MTLTCKMLRNLLKYYPESGVFVWRKSAGSRAKGQRAGNVSSSTGYRRIRINKKNYSEHRLAWLYVYGEWPSHGLDHINHDIADNRISNLRDTTQRENGRNRRLHNTNRSGVCGVCSTPSGRWRAYLATNTEAHCYLGTFDTIDEAAKVVEQARVKHGYHANHGQDKV